MMDNYYGDQPHEETVETSLPVKQNNTLGVVGLVSGILGLVFAICCSPIGVLLGITALVCGIIANNRNQKYGLAGIILGAISLALGLILSIVVLPIFLVAFFEALAEGGY